MNTLIVFRDYFVFFFIDSPTVKLSLFWQNPYNPTFHLKWAGEQRVFVRERCGVIGQILYF